MKQDANGQWVSDDGHWIWDGSAWQPVGASSPDPHGQLSPDGRWRWDGTAWQPVENAPAAASSPVQALIAAGMPVSDDGHWVWDGKAWLATGA